MPPSGDNHAAGCGRPLVTQKAHRPSVPSAVSPQSESAPEAPPARRPAPYAGRFQWLKPQEPLLASPEKAPDPVANQHLPFHRVKYARACPTINRGRPTSEGGLTALG